MRRVRKLSTDEKKLWIKVSETIQKPTASNPEGGELKEVKSETIKTVKAPSIKYNKSPSFSKKKQKHRKTLQKAWIKIR